MQTRHGKLPLSSSRSRSFTSDRAATSIDEVILDYNRCRCGTVRKQTNLNGFTNLMQHVLRQHPDHEAVMLDATTAETGSVVNFVTIRHKIGLPGSTGLLGPILPFHFARAGRQEACMGGVVQAVEHKIAAELSSRFGIMFDG
ncbi:hypothetical protein PHMEG_00021501 [Phytophthora megakarya]|uniref:Uncharacterized protein n=1 Tax=Phytophthora megakarya TaxID=4795 RepID=A0A225VMZ3_9STRA|nr:hypothetical protein PHMEG_00021501 [Phytophthora megakarya]